MKQLDNRVGFSGTLNPDESTSLSVETARATQVMILIDDGQSGSKPSQYSLKQEIFTQEFDDYHFYDTVTEEQSRSWIDSAFGEKMRFTFTNTSGSAGDYRIVINVYQRR
jgi:hypothetical protein